MHRRWYCLALTWLAISACRREPASAPLPAVDDPLAFLTPPTLTGEPLDLAALRGKVVVVNFWSPG